MNRKINVFKTTLTRCRHIDTHDTVKTVTIAKFELSFTRYRHNLKMIENSTVTNSVQSLQEFDAREMYLRVNKGFVQGYKPAFAQGRKI